MTTATTVTTTSGVEVVVTFLLVDSILTATATALTSPFTRNYDQFYLQEEARYLESVAAHGLSEAGEPPLSGAEQYLTEIEIRPTILASPPGTDDSVRYSGGSGTEWTVVWTWSSPSNPAQFIVVTPISTTTIQMTG